MEWAEIDAIVWIAIDVALVWFLVRAAVAWMQSQGWLSDGVAQGILSFVP